MLPTASLQAFKDSSSSQTDRQDLPQQAAGQALATARNSPSYSNLKCGERNSAGMSQAIHQRIIQTMWSGMTTPPTEGVQQDNIGYGNFIPAL